MGRSNTVASVVGVVAGASYLIAHEVVTCGSMASCLPGAPGGLEGTIAVVLSVLLILDSLASFVGPRALLYFAGAVCVLIDAIEALNHSEVVGWAFYFTVALVTLSLTLDVYAARRKTGVSEQSNPMNLPVFG